MNFWKNIDELKLFFLWQRRILSKNFEQLIWRMDQIDKRVRAYLYDIEYHKWARVHYRVKLTWTLTSNIAESINNTNRIARRLPIVCLMDFMRLTVETWNEK